MNQMIRQARRIARDNLLVHPRRMARDNYMTPLRRMARDGANPNSPNVLGRVQQAKQFGWIAPILSCMGTTSRWVMSLNPDNQIEIGNSYALEGIYTTPNALYNACALAVAGQAGKTQLSFLWSGTAALTFTLTTNTLNAFGVYIKLTNSPLNFKFGTYEFSVQNGSTVLGYFTCIVHSLPVEIIAFFVSNNVGKMNVVGNTTPTLVIPYSATSGALGNLNAINNVTTDSYYAETLNMRDIGNIVGAINQGAILL